MQCTRPGWGHLKDAVSAQEALQGSKTETRALLGGMKENNIFPNEGSLICPLGKTKIFYKKQTEKNKLVTRPDGQVWKPVRNSRRRFQDCLLSGYVWRSKARSTIRQKVLSKCFRLLLAWNWKYFIRFTEFWSRGDPCTQFYMLIFLGAIFRQRETILFCEFEFLVN